MWYLAPEWVIYAGVSATLAGLVNFSLLVGYLSGT